MFDLFLFPSLIDEDEILSDVGVVDSEEEVKGFAKYPVWKYLVALAIILILMGRAVLAHRKYKGRKGLLGQKTKSVRVEREVENTEGAGDKVEKKSEENEPGYLDEALAIIKKHDGRLSQKELRKEMRHLSEAKVSLILTELEHKGKIERIKKGRGKVVILK